MLSAEELLEFKKRPIPTVYSLGPKGTSEGASGFNEAQLNAKLANMEELLSLERIKMSGLLSKAVWSPILNKAEVVSKVGPHWDVLGHSENGKIYIHPEEALYMIDIGALEVTYNSVPLSLQRAYYLFANSNENLARYRVYAHLSLLGYKVLRHSAKNVLTKYERDINIHKISTKHKDVTTDLKRSTQSAPMDQNSSSKNEEDTLEELKRMGPRRMDIPVVEDVSIDFDVFMSGTESAPFKKTTVQLPTMRIKVFSHSQRVPSWMDICSEAKHFEDDVPLVHAIVYPDTISFLEIAPVELPDVR